MIFKPDTVRGWHRKSVRHKWTFKQKGKPGRPRMTAEHEALIVRLAKVNPRWGYDKIQGELLKLGFKAPKANAFAERWVRLVREECLDHILILNESHLHRVSKSMGRITTMSAHTRA
jgi:hypothetical protein